MKHWQQYNETEKLQLLDITSAAKALPRLAVEKDKDNVAFDRTNESRSITDRLSLVFAK